MGHLRSFLDKPHATDEDTAVQCTGEWLAAAKQILEWNGIELPLWQGKVLRCLTMGRRKNNNIMLLGPANCGKVILFCIIFPLLDYSVNK